MYLKQAGRHRCSLADVAVMHIRALAYQSLLYQGTMKREEISAANAYLTHQTGFFGGLPVSQWCCRCWSHCSTSAAVGVQQQQHLIMRGVALKELEHNHRS